MEGVRHYVCRASLARSLGGAVGPLVGPVGTLGVLVRPLGAAVGSVVAALAF